MSHRLILATLALTLPFAAPAQSQDKPSDDHPATAASNDHPSRVRAYAPGTDCHTFLTRVEQADCNIQLTQTRIIRLNNTDSQNSANEIMVAVRNMFDPSLKVYLVAGQQAVAVAAFPQELDQVEAFIRQLDQPHRTYRLTYTVTDTEGGKRIGVQHFSMIVKAGQRTTLKQGSKIPVATGSYTPTGANANATETQFTYLDVGMNFDATLEQTGDNLLLKTKVEESSAAESRTISSVEEPVIRQTVTEGNSTLTLNKPLMLASADIVGSTRHTDIEVVAERVP